MARFRAEITGQAPLALQLTTPATDTAEVIELVCEGETTFGTVTRPTFSFPSTVGVGSNSLPIASLNSIRTPAATVASSFSTFPSLSAGDTGTYLPIRVHWVTRKGQGIFLPPSTSALLYAFASSGATWSGAIVWEEP